MSILSTFLLVLFVSVSLQFCCISSLTFCSLSFLYRIQLVQFSVMVSVPVSVQFILYFHALVLVLRISVSLDYCSFLPHVLILFLKRFTFVFM